MTKTAGLDWSMSSPGLVIGNGPNPEDLLYYGIRQKKKQVSLQKNLILLESDDAYSCNSERYYKLAKRYVDILIEHSIKTVYMEGYAFSATGNTFNIGECTGILKLLLWQNDIDLIIFQPSDVKKFATGKGNANKTLMYDSYINKTNHHIDKLIDDERRGDKIPSPVNDMIDGYFLLQRGLSMLSD